MKKRLTSCLLTLSMLLSMLPVSAFATEAETPPEGPGSEIIIGDIPLVRNGVPTGEPFPAGASYDQGSSTLTLGSASLDPVHILDFSGLTIVLNGDTTVRNDGSFFDLDGVPQEPFTISAPGGGLEAPVTITGPGSLTVDATGSGSLRAFVVDHSALAITGGATVNVREDAEPGHWAFEVVSGSLTMDGGSSLSVYGQGGILLSENKSNQGALLHSFSDCTVTTNRLTLRTSGSDGAVQVTIGEGARFQQSSAAGESRWPIPLELKGSGSHLILDGGEVVLDTSAAPDGAGPVLSVTGDALLELRSGTLRAESAGAHGLSVDSGTLLQSGGTLSVETGSGPSGESCAALGIGSDGQVRLTGGTADLTGNWGVSMTGTLNVSGGELKALTTGKECVSVMPGGSLSVTSGSVSLESHSFPSLSSTGGQLNLQGGNIHLHNENSPAALVAGSSSAVVLGPDMHIIDDSTGEELRMETGDEYRVLGSSVTISGKAGTAGYSCALSIPSGEVTQGAAFSVRAVVTLGAESGEVSFPLPEGVSYVPGSLTVDGQAVTPESTSPLTASIQRSGAVRFNAVAGDKGEHTLTANITAGGKSHRETLPFTVSAFRLSLPGQTARTELPVSGTAVPESAITFYEGDHVLGSARTNALGTWSGTVTLPEEPGAHTVYALAALPDGGSFRSDSQVVTYTPDADEVRTLTVSNYVHGRTTADPPVEETLVMNFVTWKDSANHYTYWPDLPTFTFRVDFVKDSSAQSSVSVVTTNRLGQETEIPLRYQAAQDAWVGTHDFAEDDAPYRFRVEYVPGTAKEDGPVVSGQFTYDDRGNVVRAVYPGGREYTYTYDSENKPTQASGGGITYYYDEQGRVSRAVDGEGEDIRVTYDGGGCISRISFSDGGYIAYTRDENGRVLSATDGETTCYFNDDIQVARITTEEGTAELTYNADGTLGRITYPDGTYTAYTYDAGGMVSRMTDGKTTLSFRYEGDETFMSDGEGTTVSWSPSFLSADDLADLEHAYDGGSFSVTTPEGSISYRGGQNEITTTVAENGGDVLSYTCDLEGRVTAMSENGAVTSLSYDKKGNLTRIAYPNGKSVSYQYDAQDRITLVTDSEGYQTGYQYDGEDRITAVTDGTRVLASFQYNAGGSLARQDNANGTYTLYSYSGEHISSVEHYGAGGLLSSFAYTCDGAGRVTSMTDSTGTWTYSYDGAGQLTRAAAPDGSVTTYAYDAAGNRTQVTKDGSTVSYTANGENQYTAFGDTTRTYDAGGNLLTETRNGKTARYTWNSFGQLVGCTGFDGSVYEYGYDAFGLRDRVTANGVTTTYLNDPLGYGMPIASYGGTGEQHYVQTGALAAVRTGGSTYYYNANLLGSVTEITDGAGTAVNRYTYDQEGNLTGRTEGIANPFTYVGIYGLVNNGNGLIYDRARYVSTETGSFISKDPAGTLYDANLYRYAGNDPVGSIDISGEFALKAGKFLELTVYSQTGKTAAKRFLLTEAAAVQNEVARKKLIEAAKKKLIEEAAEPTVGLYLDVKGFALQEVLIGGTIVGVIGFITLPVLTTLPIFNNKPSTDPSDPSMDNPSDAPSTDPTGGNPGDNPGGNPGDNPGGNPGGNPGTSDPSENPDSSNTPGYPEEELPPSLRALENPVVEVYSWISMWPPAKWVVYPVYGGAYIAERWPNNPITKAGGWIGDKIGRILYPDPDPDDWSDMILDPPNTPPSSIKGRGPIGNPELYPGKLQPGTDPKEKVRTGTKSKIVTLDPSGYVYEGIESNRLTGVTTTLYYSGGKSKPKANASESQKWDASRFDQSNPLTTDAMGQYLWMVPDGWWQVKYEKAGYETAYSDWLPVPPTQTEVNMGLVSTAPATLTLSGEVEDGALVLRFDRPVRLSTVTGAALQLTRNGAALSGTLEPVDAAAADNGQLCATTFYFRLPAGETLRDKDSVTAAVSGVVTYAGTASTGNASVTVANPMPFVDVGAGDYYYDSVLWAVNHTPQITSGTNAEGTKFAPDLACTRAQAVTFLWRAMGEPEPVSHVNPFSDVDEGAYYYKAVLWAVENGITSGTNADGTTFSPNALCTRGQIVTLLHRTEKEQAPSSGANPFGDVDASAYYYKAVLWAVEWGITSGTNADGTLFSPDAVCTRAQIVTFLCRDMK